MELKNKPVPCPFCGGTISVGVDPQTLDSFIECRNSDCIGKPRWRGIQYGQTKEVLEELIDKWNKALMR